MFFFLKTHLGCFEWICLIQWHEEKVCFCFVLFCTVHRCVCAVYPVTQEGSVAPGIFYVKKAKIYSVNYKRNILLYVLPLAKLRM